MKAINLDQLVRKPVEDWTLFECKAYCEASRQGFPIDCETDTCLLNNICKEEWKHAPLSWQLTDSGEDNTFYLYQ